tara:strand:+ start:922 stop:1848 length:927 start_codon:yes stop_codon:yes gene_type:complete
MAIPHNWTPPLDDVIEACSTLELQEIAWCVGSPTLMESSPGVKHVGEREAEAARMGFEAWMERAISKGYDPNSIERESGNQRLGRRFERCVSDWFRYHPDWVVKAANHAVQLDNRTTGEIDLLLAQDGALLHLELAVKFYLSTCASADWKTWVGINPVDCLNTKLNKFKTQLDLSTRPEVITHLEQFGWKINRWAAWMKGWFFEHYQRITNPVLPLNASANCNVGWWCHEKDWPEIWTSAGDWVAIAPHHWLRVRHDANDVMTLANATELPINLSKKRGCMVAMVEREDDICKEIMRGIVVSDRWPIG